MVDSSAVKDAATIIILREADAGFEVFMVKRHSRSRFMANRYVYPGGKLDEADCTDRAAGRVEGLTPRQARRRLAEQVDPPVALGLFLAGIRETFEEAGILLARRADERRLIDLTAVDDVAARFQDYRDQLMDGRLALSELAEREDLVFPLDRLGYFAHWITPEVEPKRYDTRFFLALAPDSQRPLHDDRETTDSTWIRPARAIEANRDGDLQLAPPTLRTLQRLAAFDTAEDAFDWALQHDPPTILPQMEQRDDQVWITLPGDDGLQMVAESPGLWRVVG